MRRGYFIGLGIGTALGIAWMVATMSLFGRTWVYLHWVNIHAVLGTLLLIAVVAAATAVWFFLED